MTEQNTLQVGDVAYLTKYALSKGKIEKHKVKGLSKSYASIRRNGSPWDSSFKIGTHIHATEAEAIAACEKDRIKREASLRKQLDAISKLKFEVVGDE